MAKDNKCETWKWPHVNIHLKFNSLYDNFITVMTFRNSDIQIHKMVKLKNFILYHIL